MPSALAKSEPAASIPETAPLGHTVRENDGSKDSSVVQDESILSARSYAQSGGDAPSPELGPVYPTPTSEGGSLDDVLMPAAEDVLCAYIEQPAKDLAVMDGIGKLIGKVDPAVVREKRVSPRGKANSSFFARCAAAGVIPY